MTSRLPGKGLIVTIEPKSYHLGSERRLKSSILSIDEVGRP